MTQELAGTVVLRLSVLDTLCRAHNLDNLYVVDVSFIPSSTAMNSARTIAAQAQRVGDHLRKRIGVDGASDHVTRVAGA
jgi:choline dehydrogenase-like flavoprotein